MRVEQTSHSEQGQWLYEYDLYNFIEADTVLVGRSYRDEATEVHFLRIEESGKSRMIVPGDLSSDLCKEAIKYLKEIGKSEINWLNAESENGYSSVETAT